MRFFAIAALAGAAAATYGPYTVTSKEVVTITSCGPEVTNCPAKTPAYTPSVAPVVTPSAVSVAPVVNSNGTHYTSTIYSTSVYTITSCASTVTNCPASATGVTTVVVAVSTTVCPVTEAQATTPSTLIVSPSTKWGQTGGVYPTKATPSPSWYGTASYSAKPTSSLTPFTGAASHAKAGTFVAGVGMVAALFL